MKALINRFTTPLRMVMPRFADEFGVEKLPLPNWCEGIAMILRWSVGFGLLLAAFASTCEAQTVRRIETSDAVLLLNARSGDLIGLQWKDPATNIIGEGKLGENFRILLPRPDYEAEYFNSQDQVLAGVQQSRDGIELHYDRLRNERETVNVSVTYRIQDDGSQLHFSIEVNNKTDRPLAEVFYGVIGGQQGISNRTDTESLVPGGYGFSNLAPHLFTQYAGGGQGGGNLGVPYDIAGFTYPGQMSMGWVDVFNEKAGIGYYYANQDPDTRISAFYTELHPYTTAISPKDNWPSAANLPAGEPVGLTMGWIDFPYVRHGTFKAGPVALQVHTGDWHEGSKIYRSWFDQHFAVKRPPSWLRQQMAWQSTIINNQEDVVHHRFSDLPKMAADAKQYGVTTFEIIGFNEGGIDRNYPDWGLDPRLGTEADFRKALNDIRAMGVHPLLYVDVQCADTGVLARKPELARYAIEGRWSRDPLVWGFGEGTIGARLGRSLGGTALRHMAVMSPAHPEFRKLITDQDLDLLADGGDGFQIDHATFDGVLDFNPESPLPPDKSLTVGLLTTFKELLDRGRRINPSIALASEDQFDRAFPYIDVSYLRMYSKDADSIALRYTFPEWTSTIFGENPGDFDPMNNGLRYGLVWGLAPRHYNASLDESLTRPLSRYVSELIRVRGKHKDLLFLGRYDDTRGASVTGGNSDDIRYSVFENYNPSNARAVVVVNFGNRDQTVDVAIDGKAGHKAEIDMPFEPDRYATLPARITVKPHHAAVVIAHK